MKPVSYAVDAILSAYGRFIPYHPGRWRISAALESFARDAWVSDSRLVRRNGILYELDLRNLVERAICYDGCYEPYEMRAILKLLQPGSVCFDIGANIGYYTLNFAKLGATVYAFEPAPINLERLRRNVQLNKANVTIIPCAVGDQNGEIGMSAPSLGNHGTIWVTDQGKIPIVTLDSFVKAQSIQHLDLIKVDIEGCEARLIRGAIETIKRFHPTILMELNPEALAKFSSSASDLVASLTGLGYKLCRPRWYGLAPMDRPPRTTDYFNILAR